VYGQDGLCPANPRIEEELFAEENSGINFEKYEDIPILIEDKEKHEQIEKFSDIDLGPVINHNLKLAHFETPTPIQKASIPIVLKKRDLMACAQTGSGKTAAFLFPLISLILKDGTNSAPPVRNYRDRVKISPECLILAPTRELACQIHNQARKFTYRSHLKSVVVYGGADFRSQVNDLEKGCNILVATPGRLLDMTERGKVSLASLRYLCIDEADRMLDMGFGPQIKKIVDECPGVDDRQTLMFSATFPRDIQSLAQEFLKEYVFLRVGRIGSTTDYITQKIEYVEDNDKKGRLVEILNAIDGLTLVFVETKRLADHLEEFLYNKNFPVVSIHGDRSQKEREQALELFRTGKVRIMVATDVAARGLDVKEVKHVINYDLPHDVNDYVHRIGRTGRCGAEGLATAFFNDKNKNIARELVELLEESTQEVESWMYQYTNPHGHSFTKSQRGGKRGGGGGTGNPRSAGGGRWAGSRNNRETHSTRNDTRNTYMTYSNPSGHATGTNQSSQTSLSSSKGYSGPSYSSGGNGSFHSSDQSNFVGGSDPWWS
jgi:ATP-dependent RNA helicase DDX3X